VWRPPSLQHLEALSDDVGILQHAVYDVPNRLEGYCTDDVARAFMVALAASRHPAYRERASALGGTYLAFLFHAQRPDGQLRNFMSYARSWLDECGTEDSNGRAIWALGFGMRFAARTEWRSLCATMLERALPQVAEMRFLRSRAYAALGLCHARSVAGARAPAVDAALVAIGDDLRARRDAHAAAGWNWFENEMTYDNARLSEALLRIGMTLQRPQDVAAGLETLAFYESIVVQNGCFVPIGNAGWYRRSGTRAIYAQQPLEAASFGDAAVAAYEATGDARYHDLADLGREWFLGRNTREVVMAPGNGGCYDGLEETGPNENMGAESTLAYLWSAFSQAKSEGGVTRIAR